MTKKMPNICLSSRENSTHSSYLLMFKACKSKKICVLFLFVCLFSCDLQAQWLPAYSWARRHHKTVARSAPTKTDYSAKLDSLMASFRQYRYEASDTLANPFYASVFGSPSLYGSTISRTMSVPDAGSVEPQLESSRHIYELTEQSDYYLLQTYASYPWLVEHEEASQGTVDVDSQIREGAKPDVTLTERFAEKESVDVAPPALPEGEDVEIVVRKPNFWDFKSNISFQFTQNYISDNWYKGGESHVSLLASTVLEANYNNQRKLTFDNKLEMKIGFQTSQNDEEHKYKTNSDLIRLTNKLGLKAIKDWNYAAMLQSWTQFYHGYKSNDPKVYSDFMSPFESLLSLGMDYKKTTKNKKFTISATLSPLALKLTYVDRPSLVTTFGVDEGHHAKWDYGSNITVNYTWTVMKNVSWTGRIYWFTDYSKTQLEWENTFNLTINKYLSAKLFLYPRFDDSTTREEGESYFQFNELLSLGLNLDF